MNQEQFLKELSMLLQHLPKNERDDILYDYQEHFAIGLEEGKSEEEIARKLGSPESIVKELQTLDKVEFPKNEPQQRSAAGMIVVAFALMFFNITMVFGLVVGIFATVISLFVSGIVMICAPLLKLLDVIINNDATLSDFFVSLIACGVGLLLVCGLIPATKWLWKVFVSYINWNIRVIKGE